MPIARNNRYQEGSLDRVSRAKGPEVWVYRWRELNEEGVRVQRKKTIGTVEEYPKSQTSSVKWKTFAQRSTPDRNALAKSRWQTLGDTFSSMNFM